MIDVPSLSVQELQPGHLVDSRYEIIRAIASGGMASVYLVRDTETNTQLALKMLHKEFADDKTYIQRFIREVKMMNGIDHPNIVRSYDIGADDGMIYFTMEYVPGQTLEQLMESKRFSTEEIGKLVIDICEALTVIHSHNIIHRDLKPANILVTDEGTTKVVDFGVARDKSSRLTQPNQKVGSLCYISPETWLGKKPTPAVDFYSLGIMLYELVVGEVPFDDPLPGKMLDLHLKGRVVPPIERNPSTPRWLNDLILKLLEKAPKDRPRTAQSIVELVRWGLGHNEKQLPPRVHQNDPTGGATALNMPTITLGQLQQQAITPLRQPPKNQGKTYVFRLTATQVFDQANNPVTTSRPKRKATVVINLPRRAAVILEIEAPSRDAVSFGIFLASLQVVDGVLTSMGVRQWGTSAEANPLLRWLMHQFGADNGLMVAKAFAILLVVFLTVVARRRRLFKDLIGALSCFYLFAAVIPWVYLLSCVASKQGW